MKKRLWNIGMKCPNLQEEVEFNRKMGHEIVIEREAVSLGGQPQYQALVRVGDKYLVLAEKFVGLEKLLPQELPYGATHMSHSVDDIDAAVKTALDAGETRGGNKGGKQGETRGQTERYTRFLGDFVTRGTYSAWFRPRFGGKPA